MALTKLNDDLNVVQGLDNEPNDVGGLSADELKAKFDAAPNIIKEYINEQLVPEVESKLEEINKTKATKDELAGVVLGQIPDGSLTLSKMAQEFFDNYYSKSDAMTAADVRRICT